MAGWWWLEHGWIMTFHMNWEDVGNFIIPTDELHHFSEGVGWNHQSENLTKNIWTFWNRWQCFSDGLASLSLFFRWTVSIRSRIGVLTGDTKNQTGISVGYGNKYGNKYKTGFMNSSFTRVCGHIYIYNIVNGGTNQVFTAGCTTLYEALILMDVIQWLVESVSEVSGYPYSLSNRGAIRGYCGFFKLWWFTIWLVVWNIFYFSIYWE